MQVWGRQVASNLVARSQKTGWHPPTCLRLVTSEGGSTADCWHCGHARFADLRHRQFGNFKCSSSSSSSKYFYCHPYTKYIGIQFLGIFRQGTNETCVTLSPVYVQHRPPSTGLPPSMTRWSALLGYQVTSVGTLKRHHYYSYWFKSRMMCTISWSMCSAGFLPAEFFQESYSSWKNFVEPTLHW